MSADNEEFNIPFEETRRGRFEQQEEKALGRRLGEFLASRAIDRPSIGKNRRRRGGFDVDVPTGGKPGTRRPTGSRRDTDGDGWADEGTTKPVWVGVDKDRDSLGSGRTEKPAESRRNEFYNLVAIETDESTPEKLESLKEQLGDALVSHETSTVDIGVRGQSNIRRKHTFKISSSGLRNTYAHNYATNRGFIAQIEVEQGQTRKAPSSPIPSGDTSEYADVDSRLSSGKQYEELVKNQKPLSEEEKQKIGELRDLILSPEILSPEYEKDQFGDAYAVRTEKTKATLAEIEKLLKGLFEKEIETTSDIVVTAENGEKVNIGRRFTVQVNQIMVDQDRIEKDDIQSAVDLGVYVNPYLDKEGETHASFMVGMNIVLPKEAYEKLKAAGIPKDMYPELTQPADGFTPPYAQIGKTSRTIDSSGGTFTVKHNSLFLNKPAQGKGIGSAFNAQNEQWYRELGVEAIFTEGLSENNPLDGAYSIGATHWPRNGFTWGSEESKQSFLGALDSSLRYNKDKFSAEEYKRLRYLINYDEDSDTYSTSATAEELVDFKFADRLFQEDEYRILYMRKLPKNKKENIAVSNEEIRLSSGMEQVSKLENYQYGNLAAAKKVRSEKGDNFWIVATQTGGVFAYPQSEFDRIQKVLLDRFNGLGENPLSGKKAPLSAEDIDDKDVLRMLIDDGKPVSGMLTWRPARQDGNREVYKIETRAKNRRQGLASELFYTHREVFPEENLQHSDALSDDGKEFAAATPAIQPLNISDLKDSGDGDSRLSSGKKYEELVARQPKISAEKKETADDVIALLNSEILKDEDVYETVIDFNDDEIKILQDTPERKEIKEEIFNRLKSLFDGELKLEKNIIVTTESGQKVDIGDTVVLTVEEPFGSRDLAVKVERQTPRQRQEMIRLGIYDESFMNPENTSIQSRISISIKPTPEATQKIIDNGGFPKSMIPVFVPSGVDPDSMIRLAVAERQIITVIDRGSDPDLGPAFRIPRKNHVIHSLFTIDETLQGQGIGSALNARNEKIYEALDVDSIFAQGLSDETYDGAVFWGKNGFDFAGVKAKQTALSIIDDAIKTNRLSDEEARRISALYSINPDTGMYETNTPAEFLLDFKGASDLFKTREATVEYTRKLKKDSLADSGRLSSGRLSVDQRIYGKPGEDPADSLGISGLLRKSSDGKENSAVEINGTTYDIKSSENEDGTFSSFIENENGEKLAEVVLDKKPLTPEQLQENKWGWQVGIVSVSAKENEQKSGALEAILDSLVFNNPDSGFVARAKQASEWLKYVSNDMDVKGSRKVGIFGKFKDGERANPDGDYVFSSQLPLSSTSVTTKQQTINNGYNDITVSWSGPVFDIGGEKVAFGAPEDSEFEDPSIKNILLNPFEILNLEPTSEKGREEAIRWASAIHGAQTLILPQDDTFSHSSYVSALLYASSKGDEKAKEELDSLVKRSQDMLKKLNEKSPKLEDTENALPLSSRLVHQTSYKPPIDKDGYLSIRPLEDFPQIAADGSEVTVNRATIHTAINHLAEGHLFRQETKGKSYIVIAQLDSILEQNPGSLENLSIVDTAITPPPGEGIRMAPGTFKVIEVEEGENARQIVEDALREDGVPVFKGGEMASGTPGAEDAALKRAQLLGVPASTATNLPITTYETFGRTNIDPSRRYTDTPFETTIMQTASKNSILRMANRRENGWVSFNKRVISSDRLSSGADGAPKPPRYPREPTYGAFIGGAEDVFDGVANWEEFKQRYNSRDVVWLDYETTGLDFDEFGRTASRGKPVQIGAVKVRDGKVVDRMNIYVNPGEPLLPWSRDNLKLADGSPLTDEYLAEQMSIQQAHRQFADFAGEDAIIGVQNALFDKNVLEDALSESGLDWRPSGYIDTRDVSDITLPRWTPETDDGPFTVDRDGNKKPSSSLKAITEYLGVELGDKHHSADADAEAAANVMMAIIDGAIEKGWSTDVLDRDKRREKLDKENSKFESQVREFEQNLSAYEERLSSGIVIPREFNVSIDEVLEISKGRNAAESPQARGSQRQQIIILPKAQSSTDARYAVYAQLEIDGGTKSSPGKPTGRIIITGDGVDTGRPIENPDGSTSPNKPPGNRIDGIAGRYREAIEAAIRNLGLQDKIKPKKDAEKGLRSDAKRRAFDGFVIEGETLEESAEILDQIGKELIYEVNKPTFRQDGRTRTQTSQQTIGKPEEIPGTLRSRMGKDEGFEEPRLKPVYPSRTDAVLATDPQKEIFLTPLRPRKEYPKKQKTEFLARRHPIKDESLYDEEYGPVERSKRRGRGMPAPRGIGAEEYETILEMVDLGRIKKRLQRASFSYGPDEFERTLQWTTNNSGREVTYKLLAKELDVPKSNAYFFIQAFPDMFEKIPSNRKGIQKYRIRNAQEVKEYNERLSSGARWSGPPTVEKLESFIKKQKFAVSKLKQENDSSVSFTLNANNDKEKDEALDFILLLEQWATKRQFDVEVENAFPEDTDWSNIPSAGSKQFEEWVKENRSGYDVMVYDRLSSGTEISRAEVGGENLIDEIRKANGELTSYQEEIIYDVLPSMLNRLTGEELLNEPLAEAFTDTGKALRESIAVAIASDGIPFISADPIPQLAEQIPDKRDWRKIELPSRFDVDDILEEAKEYFVYYNEPKKVWTDRDGNIVARAIKNEGDGKYRLQYENDEAKSKFPLLSMIAPDGSFTPTTDISYLAMTRNELPLPYKLAWEKHGRFMGSLAEKAAASIGDEEVFSRPSAGMASDSFIDAYLNGLSNPVDFSIGLSGPALQYYHDLFGHFGTGRGFDRHGEWANDIAMMSMINHPESFLTEEEKLAVKHAHFLIYAAERLGRGRSGDSSIRTRNNFSVSPMDIDRVVKTLAPRDSRAYAGDFSKVLNQLIEKSTNDRLSSGRTSINDSNREEISKALALDIIGVNESRGEDRLASGRPRIFMRRPIAPKVDRPSEPGRIYFYGQKGPDGKEIRKTKVSWLKGMSAEQMAEVLVPNSREDMYSMWFDDFVGDMSLSTEQAVAMKQYFDSVYVEYTDFNPEHIKEMRSLLADSLNSNPKMKWAFEQFGAPNFLPMSAKGAELYENDPRISDLLDRLKETRGTEERPYVRGVSAPYLDAIYINPRALIEREAIDFGVDELDRLMDPNRVPKKGDSHIDQSLEATLIHEWGHWLHYRMLRDIEYVSSGNRKYYGSGDVNDDRYMAAWDVAERYQGDQKIDEQRIALHEAGTPFSDDDEMPLLTTSYGHVTTREAIAEGMVAVLHPNNDVKNQHLNKKLREDIHTLLGIDDGDAPWERTERLSSGAEAGQEEQKKSGGRLKRLIKKITGEEGEEVAEEAAQEQPKPIPTSRPDVPKYEPKTKNLKYFQPPLGESILRTEGTVPKETTLLNTTKEDIAYVPLVDGIPNSMQAGSASPKASSRVKKMISENIAGSLEITPAEFIELFSQSGADYGNPNQVLPFFRDSGNFRAVQALLRRVEDGSPALFVYNYRDGKIEIRQELLDQMNRQQTYEKKFVSKLKDFDLDDLISPDFVEMQRKPGTGLLDRIYALDVTDRVGGDDVKYELIFPFDRTVGHIKDAINRISKGKEQRVFFKWGEDEQWGWAPFDPTYQKVEDVIEHVKTNLLMGNLKLSEDEVKEIESNNGIIVADSNNIDSDEIRNILKDVLIQHVRKEAGIKDGISKAERELDKDGYLLLDASTEEGQRYFMPSLVSDVIHTWAISANNSNPVALAIQNIVREMFGLDKAVGWDLNIKRKIGNNPDLVAGKLGAVSVDRKTPDMSSEEFDGSPKISPQQREFLKTMLQAMYDATQKYFEDKGITHVPVWRGMRLPPGSKTPRGDEMIASTAVMRPLSSWTFNSSMASSFAYMNAGELIDRYDPEGSIIMKGFVPVSDVFSIPLTGFGCLGEDEAVLLGRPLDVISIAPVANLQDYQGDYEAYQARLQSVADLTDKSMSEFAEIHSELSSEERLSSGRPVSWSAPEDLINWDAITNSDEPTADFEELADGDEDYRLQLFNENIAYSWSMWDPCREMRMAAYDLAGIEASKGDPNVSKVGGFWGNGVGKEPETPVLSRERAKYIMANMVEDVISDPRFSGSNRSLFRAVVLGKEEEQGLLEAMAPGKTVDIPLLSFVNIGPDGGQHFLTKFGNDALIELVDFPAAYGTTNHFDPIYDSNDEYGTLDQLRALTDDIEESELAQLTQEEIDGRRALADELEKLLDEYEATSRNNSAKRAELREQIEALTSDYGFTYRWSGKLIDEDEDGELFEYAVQSAVDQDSDTESVAREFISGGRMEVIEVVEDESGIYRRIIRLKQVGVYDPENRGAIIPRSERYSDSPRLSSGGQKPKPTRKKSTRKHDADFEKRYGQKVPDGNGDCFSTAVEQARALASRYQDVKIVHGYPLGTGGEALGLRFPHAWVEFTDRGAVIVRDYSNGNRIEFPKELYYGIGKIEERDTSKYSIEEAEKQMNESQHYGPW